MPLSPRFLAVSLVLAAFCPVVSFGQASSPPSNAASDAPGNQPADVKAPKVSPGGQDSSSKVSATGSSKDSPAAASKSYVIGSLDVLDVKVWNDPKLSGILDVRPDGMISMPLAGEIKADGMTVSELAKTIAGKLASVFVDAPEVNIQVLRYNSKKYYIFGGVRRPGEFQLTADTTVMDALVNGSGFTDFANPKKIYVLRGTEKLKFNYKDVSQGKHMEQNILLQNGDKIFVPE